MIIAILGPQGSGKGTQAKMLVEKYQLYYFEAGNFLRELAKTREDIREQINRGVLLPDEVMFGLVKDYLTSQNVHENIIFDGYPRSVKQYELITDWLASFGNKIDLVVCVSISEEETIRRLSARRMDPKTGNIYNLITNPPSSEIDVNSLIYRDDDQPDAIKRRLEAYHSNTEPLVQRLKADDKLYEVNGEAPIETIHQEIVAIVEKYKNEKA